MSNCMNCGMKPISTEPYDGVMYARDENNNIKYWDLCEECYCTFDENALLFKDYQDKVYWKKYKKYGIKPAIPECLWFSCRPPHDIDEREFIKRIEKFIKSETIKKAEYSFEWKYKDNKRYGIHCHMLLWGGKDWCKVNQHISRQKERYFKLCLKEQKFWIYPKDKHLINEKRDYVNGITLDDDKNIDKQLDKESRKILGLPDTLYKEM